MVPTMTCQNILPVNPGSYTGIKSMVSEAENVSFISKGKIRIGVIVFILMCVKPVHFRDWI
jgi:hypothetical protein